MKVGDLVINIEEPEHGLGIVLQTNVEMWGHPQEPPGIKVLWPRPTYYDQFNGTSTMYEDEVEVISEGG